MKQNKLICIVLASRTNCTQYPFFCLFRICESMGLSPFDLSEIEVKRIENQAQLLTNSLTLSKDIACLSVLASDDPPLSSPPNSPTSSCSLNSPTSPHSPPLSASSIESDSMSDSSESSSNFGESSGVCKTNSLNECFSVLN